jgi:hypothetical protein
VLLPLLFANHIAVGDEITLSIPPGNVAGAEIMLMKGASPSLGFAHLVSYLCPDRIPIGYDVTRARLQRGYDVAQFPRVPMPSTRLGLLFCLARFSLKTSL